MGRRRSYKSKVVGIPVIARIYDLAISTHKNKMDRETTIDYIYRLLNIKKEFPARRLRTKPAKPIQSVQSGPRIVDPVSVFGNSFTIDGVEHPLEFSSTDAPISEMNALTEDLILKQAREIFGIYGHARQINGLCLVGEINNGEFVPYGKGETFADAFDKARRVLEATIREQSTTEPS